MFNVFVWCCVDHTPSESRKRPSRPPGEPFSLAPLIPPLPSSPGPSSLPPPAGIHGLSKLIADNAPAAVKSGKMENYFGRKIAIDASMHLYQYMAVVGRVGDQQLTNEAGEVTSHLLGMFTRTVRMLEAGIKPIYVFDGKPPQLKRDELAKRASKR
jgi:hypothetical protein